MNLSIFSDFDETITRSNVTDEVLARFAGPSWMEIQEEWLAGRLSAREVLERQMPLVEVQPVKLNAFIDALEVDPFFADFAFACNRRGDSLTILSDGFDYWINRILRRALSGADGAVKQIAVFACSLKCDGTGVSISFPYFPDGCVHGCATCKPGLFASLKTRGRTNVVIGDGVSDFLLVQAADLVLAKGELERFCRTKGIVHHRFGDFSDVMEIIENFRGNAIHPAGV